MRFIERMYQERLFGMSKAELEGERQEALKVKTESGRIAASLIRHELNRRERENEDRPTRDA